MLIRANGVARKLIDYHKSAQDIMSRWVKPAKLIKTATSIVLTTTVLCCGILSSFYFDCNQDHEYKLPIRIARYCEKDRHLYDDIRRRLPDADARLRYG